MTAERGKFIVFCGVDGAGKTGIIEHVTNLILQQEKKNEKGKGNILNIKHPPKEWMDNPMIQAAICNKPGPKMSDMDEVKFTTSLRIKEQNELIKPALEKGYNVISDRYIFSLYTYYYLKRSLDFNDIFQITKDIILPDATIHLKISPQEAVKRVNSREEDAPEYQKRLEPITITSEGYDVIGALFDFIVIDNENSSKQATIKKCYDIINNLKVENSFKTIKDKLNEPNKVNQALNLYNLTCKSIMEHSKGENKMQDFPRK